VRLVWAIACTAALSPLAAPAAAIAAGTGAHARSSGGGTSSAAIALAVVAVVIVICALAWALAWMQAYEPRWLLSARHSMAEASMRTSATFAELRDWARLGH
jgi:hypothetical protein